MAAHWRPDPTRGVFETLLVLDSHPVEWDAHLARLESSLAALYPHLTPPPLDASGVAGANASSTPGTSVEAIRIAVAPDVDGDLAVTTERRPASGHFATENGGKVTTKPISLRSVRLTGGLGAHKWVDRSLLDAAQAQLPAGALPLIVDDGGAVLEASRANVFVVRDEAIATPPTDGRILPGVTRMRVVEIARDLGLDAREARLSRDDLLAAEEVFLSGSVRGIEAVCAVDGTPLGSSCGVTGRLAAALHQAWTEAEAAPRFG